MKLKVSSGLVETMESKYEDILGHDFESVFIGSHSMPSCEAGAEWVP